MRCMVKRCTRRHHSSKLVCGRRHWLRKLTTAAYTTAASCKFICQHRQQPGWIIYITGVQERSPAEVWVCFLISAWSVNNQNQILADDLIGYNTPTHYACLPFRTHQHGFQQLGAAQLHTLRPSSAGRHTTFADLASHCIDTDVPAQMYQHSIIKREVDQPSGSHPLLAANRSCRDMVLNSIHSITLDPSCSELLEASDFEPWARLLDRACCQATPGLTVKLCLSNMRLTYSLHELLQPGIDCGGWSKVHSLEVRCAFKRMHHGLFECCCRA
jgi:hypothetical protein